MKASTLATLTLLAFCGVATDAIAQTVPAGAKAVTAPSRNYLVGPQDVLGIRVFDQAELGGRYVVESDGTFTFPFIGRVDAAGFTLRAIEESITKRLANGVLKNPQVAVAIEEYRSQRVYVIGEVRNPGIFPLTGATTVIEVLAKAGSTTAIAGDDVLVVRPKTGTDVSGPVLPDQGVVGADVIRIDIRALQGGQPVRNVELRDNDTIYVPKAEIVYVFGNVKSPGAFPLARGTTVRQAVALAGGPSRREGAARITVARVIEGERRELQAELDELVRAGDTLMVP